MKKVLDIIMVIITLGLWLLKNKETITKKLFEPTMTWPDGTKIYQVESTPFAIAELTNGTITALCGKQAIFEPTNGSIEELYTKLKESDWKLIAGMIGAFNTEFNKKNNNKKEQKS